MATDVVSRVTTIIAATDKASAVVGAIQRKLEGLGSTAATVGSKFRALADRSGLSSIPGLIGKLRGEAVDLGKDFLKMVLPLVGLGAGGATVLGLLDLEHGLHAFIEQGSRLNIVSQRIGTTVGTLQDLEHAAELMNVPAEIMDTNLGRLNRTLAQVAVGKNKEATKLLGFVGIAARDAKGHVRSAADVLPQLADVFAKIHNPAQRARLAVGLFGKGGQALIPVLIQGSRGLQQARADMDKLGRMTAGEAEQAHALEMSQTRLTLAFRRIAQIIGLALAPYVKKATDGMINWIGANRKWLEGRIHYYIDLGAKAVKHWWNEAKQIDWKGWLKGLADTATYLKSWIDFFGGVNVVLGAFVALLFADKLLAFAGALKIVAEGIKFVTLAMYENPYLAVGALLLTLVIAVYKYWNQITHYFRYYGKVVVKYTTVYFQEVEDFIARTLGTTRDKVQEKLDAIVELFSSAWRRVADNPMVRLLGALFGIGLPGTVGMLATPVGGPDWATGRGRLPITPPTGPGPYRHEYGGYRTRSGAINGSVDVNVNIDGAPPGTRASTETSGTGLRSTTRVSHSMPRVQRGAR
jgi:hypothetical protein